MGTTQTLLVNSIIFPTNGWPQLGGYTPFSDTDSCHEMARNNIKGTSQGHNQPSIKSEIGSSGHEVETGRGFSLSRKPYRLETARAE